MPTGRGERNAAGRRGAGARRRVARTAGMVAAAVALGAALPRAGAAQFPDDFENPTGATYFDGLWLVPEPIDGCLDITELNNGFVEPRCMSDATEENATRETVKAMDRWQRAGLLLLASIYSGIEFLKDIVQGSQDVLGEVRRLVRGADRRPAMPQVAIRMMDATDAAEVTARRVEQVAVRTPFAVGETRYGDVHTLVMRALGVAREGQLHAMALTDQAAGLSARISRDSMAMLLVGGGSDAIGTNARPMLSVDADSSVLAVYGAMPGFPSTVGTWRVVQDPGPMTVGALVAVPPEVAGGGAGVARLGGVDGGGPQRSGPAPLLSCPADDRDVPDPITVTERATVQAVGAQTAAVATEADVREVRDEVRTVREREQVSQREAFWLALLRFLRSL